MIGQRDRHHSPADALPAGRRHDRRCTLLVQHAIADPHVGRRDQFGSHGHCLHRATDSDTVTSLLGSILHRFAHPWTFPSPHGWCCCSASTTSPTEPLRPGSSPFDAASLGAGPNRPVHHGSGSGWNCQFGRAIPSTSEVPTAMRRHGGTSSTCPQCLAPVGAMPGMAGRATAGQPPHEIFTADVGVAFRTPLWPSLGHRHVRHQSNIRPEPSECRYRPVP